MPAAVSKRKHGAAFKPQRPTKPKSAEKRKQGRKSTTTRPQVSSDEEDDDDDDVEAEDNSDADDVEEESNDGLGSSAASASSTQSAPASSNALASLDNNPPPSIPPKLLATMLHHNLAANANSKDMRIDKDAMSTLGRYIETFTREAIARAAFERGAVNEEREKRGEKIGAGEGFLEVEDLEKMAPQLLLDF